MIRTYDSGLRWVFFLSLVTLLIVAVQSGALSAQR